ncbi:hypothetical protein GN956_G20766 [Arapaima gigas]
MFLHFKRGEERREEERRGEERRGEDWTSEVSVMRATPPCAPPETRYLQRYVPRFSMERAVIRRSLSYALKRRRKQNKTASGLVLLSLSCPSPVPLPSLSRPPVLR